jgi:hypothetical protein
LRRPQTISGAQLLPNQEERLAAEQRQRASEALVDRAGRPLQTLTADRIERHSAFLVLPCPRLDQLDGDNE